MKKNCIVIVGPTAVGKTSLAIDVALHFNTEIISADSRQCYKELDIGVAKPSAEELETVRHHFISSHSIRDEVNAAVFEKYALQRVNEIFNNHDTAVVVGGTGLYVKSFCNGIDELPAIDPAIRERLQADYEWEGIEWLQHEVEKNDPVFFASGEIRNPQRLLRALEVKLSTGRSITEFQTRQKKERDFNIITIGLGIHKDQLHKNINSRVDAMMEKGLLKEVEGLWMHKKLNALQTVGYRELFGYLAGDLPLEDAVEIIKINTRQYAKRQMTWFKKDESVRWSEVDFKKVLHLVEGSLG
jgi:tRNA dimethylallyltransferase